MKALRKFAIWFWRCYRDLRFPILWLLFDACNLALLVLAGRPVSTPPTLCMSNDCRAHELGGRLDDNDAPELVPSPGTGPFQQQQQFGKSPDPVKEPRRHPPYSLGENAHGQGCQERVLI
ncbi:hypothetical protein PIB30_104258 [Stylosanthes scabra]|uniref:Uncharacterized protein n=1 Tax=Stylosanthes scabra TaxID=79078 RepID=A0ABU6SYH6_9FABA|nr:hypothetical protein [Stylosanthes scabra]